MSDTRQSEPAGMDPELFQKLEEGLKEIFERNLEKDGGWTSSSDQLYGKTAVEAAGELRKLYRDCKPGR